jgi:pimeloyl-ACP methyl ester carboxylesterase
MPDLPTDTTRTASTAAPIQPRPRWRRVGRFLLVRVVFWYVVICLLMLVFQRRFLYQPSRPERITLEDALLPEGFVHDIEVPTADGLTLRGWHFSAGRACASPEECDRLLASETAPVVLFFHGNAADRRNRVQDSLAFTGERSHVFLIDYRGFGENPGSPSEDGLAADARGLWDYVTERRGVAPTRVVIYGESLGGGVAVRLAAELCEEGTPPAGLVLRSTFSSMVDAGRAHFPWLPVRLLLRDRYPSDKYIRSVTCPLLFVHGNADEVVPYELGRKLHAAAPEKSASGRPKEFITVEGAGHNGVLIGTGSESEQALAKFLRDVSPQPARPEDGDGASGDGASAAPSEAPSDAASRG